MHIYYTGWREESTILWLLFLCESGALEPLEFVPKHLTQLLEGLVLEVCCDIKDFCDEVYYLTEIKC